MKRKSKKQIQAEIDALRKAHYEALVAARLADVERLGQLADRREEEPRE